mgnify:FL=1
MALTQVDGGDGLKKPADFADNEKARFGTGNDLEIYHDGSNSYIQDAGTGSLTLATDGANIAFQKGSTETLAIFKTDNACELYYDNSKKLETTSAGITVTGQGTFAASAEYQAIFKDNNNTGTGAETGIAFADSGNTVQAHIGLVASGNTVFYIFNNTNEELRFGTNNTGRCKVDADGHFTPHANNTYDLGTDSLRWRNVYTNDLNLSNEGSTNDVDGTWGNYTIQEGEEDLFLINRRTGKKYKFMLQEVE